MENRYTVVLDPGHGGTSLDAGSTPNNAIGANGLLEKDLTLGIAKYVADRLPADRFNTILTRSDDRNLPLTARAARAREAGADAFVSIHFNGHRDANIDGTEVFISHASDEKDWSLANELLQTVSRTASIVPREIRKTDFTVLKGDFHVAKTAVCLIEMAYLTNPQQAQKLSSPNYVENLASAITQSIVNYSARSSHAKPFADEADEKKIADETKKHSDPKNFPLDLPEPGKGTDNLQIDIPKGLKFCRWDVEVLAVSAGSGYKVVQSPKAGAEGRQTIGVEWWHLPYGKIHYNLKAFASPDGKSLMAEKVVFEKAGWAEKAKDQISQGRPVNFVVRGNKAKMLNEAIKKKTGEQKNAVSVALDGGIISVPVAMLIIAAIIAACIVIGMFVFGALLKMAMDKGYDVKDTKYKAAGGEGASRQEHELAFNLFKPK